MVESDAVVSPAEDIAESGKLAAVVDFLAHKQRREDGALDRYYLTGLDGIDRVELTEELFDVLKRAAEGLRQGQSASLLRRDQEITTQQAAIGRSRGSAYRRPDRVAEDVVRAATPSALKSNIPSPHPTRIVVDLMRQQGPIAAVELGVADQQQDESAPRRDRRFRGPYRAHRTCRERIEAIRETVIVILTSEPTVAGLWSPVPSVGVPDLGLKYHWDMMTSWMPGGLQGLRGCETVDL